MVLQSITTVFGGLMRGISQSLHDKSKPWMKYVRYAVYGLLVAFFLGLSFTVYRWYVVMRESRAQVTFANYIEEFQQAKTDADYDTAATMFKLGYDQHSWSYLAPYFLTFQADALLKQDKKQEALAVLNEAIPQLSSSPFENLYKTKQALIQLDLQDEQGLAQLTALANDKNNSNRDMALFYLGLYHWVNDSVAQAKSVWQQLIEEFPERTNQSPWVKQAQTRLQQN